MKDSASYSGGEAHAEEVYKGDLLAIQEFIWPLFLLVFTDECFGYLLPRKGKAAPVDTVERRAAEGAAERLSVAVRALQHAVASHPVPVASFLFRGGGAGEIPRLRRA